MLESESSHVQERELKKPRHCLILTGMMTNNAGINAEHGLKKGFEKVYGADNVTAFNSVISVDAPNPHRYKEMAKVIQERAREGLDIVAHSLGVEELRRAIRIIKKTQPDFFSHPDVQNNLKIVLDSPSGFNKGIKQKIRYGRGMTQLDAPLGVAVDALDAFPMPEVSGKQLDTLMPDISNTREGFPTVAPVTIPNDAYLEESDTDAMERKASEIKSALQAKDKDGALEAFVSRGEVLHHPLTQAFEGTSEKVVKGKLQLSALGIRTAFRAFGKKSLKDFSELSQSGVKIYAKAPQFDFLVPVEMLSQLYENDKVAKERIEIVEKSGHRGFALQPEGYAKIIHASGEEKKTPEY